MNYGSNIYVNCKPYSMPRVEGGGALTAPNKKGKYYYGGRVTTKLSEVKGQTLNAPNGFFEYTKASINTVDIVSNSKTAILAIPIKFTCDFISPQANNYTIEFMKKVYNVYKPYVYYIISNGSLSSMRSYPLAGKLTYSMITYDYRVEAKKLGEALNQPQSTFDNVGSYVSLASKVQDLHRYYNVNENGYPWIQNGTLIIIDNAMERNPNLANLRCYKLNLGSDTYPFWCGTELYTNMPVFTYDHMDEMAKYFSNEDYKADNEEELIISELDLKTDWTIYVNGAQNPNISTTWKSNALETFLDSDSNKTGLTKENVQVEFRYPLYEHTGFGLGLSESEYSQDSLVYDGGYNYNSKKNDSYESLMFQNYPYLKERFEVDSFIYGENSEPRIETEKEFYSQLQFRLKINEQKFSSWCYFNIGVIGSPNVADFSLMQNEGNVLASVISDGSTVTIVYDESPAGEQGDKDYIDPTPDPPDIDPSEPTPINPTESGLNLLTTSYVMTEEQIKQLANFLWGATFLQNLKLVNNSPIENIVGCKMMPIAISGSNNVVQIGNVDTNVNGAVVSSVPIVTIGSLSIGKLYDNFLDYAPYTQITLFLPFIGFVEIDTNVVVDNTLTVKYVFDIVTGTCKAMLYVNGIYYTSYNGSCGIDIPLVASNRAQVESQFLSSVINGAISGNVGGIVGAGIGAQYHSQSSGSYSPTCGWQETKQVYAIINRPTCQYPETYGHNIGYPCKLSRSLNSLSGFTVCDSNVDLSGISCTEMERQEIYNALTSGVYL